MEIYGTDIKDKKEFTFQGDKLVFEKDYGDGIYLYKRFDHYNNFKFMGYEIVKSVKRKQPNGKIVYLYPSSEQFGSYGLFLPPRSNSSDIEKAHQTLFGKNNKKKGD